MSVKKYDSTTKLLKLIAGGTLWADCPLGTINAFGGSTAPEGWLLCQGQAISRTDYADLFEVIGTNFGAGDGSTTFNLPDLRGKVTVGMNSGDSDFDTIGETGGEKTHTLTVTEMPAHNHTIRTQFGAQAINDASHNYNTGSYIQISNDAAYQDNKIANKGGGGAHNNLQPYEVVNFIMKAKQTAMPADLRAALEAALDDKDLLVWG